MRLVSFHEGSSSARAGLLSEDGRSVIDLSASTGEPTSVLDLITHGVGRLGELRSGAESARRLPVHEIRLTAPIPCPPRNIICVGKNYREHAAEFQGSGFDASSGGEQVPAVPVVFTKNAGSVIGPGDPIPASSDPDNSVDYEGELGVVIGAPGRNIAQSAALFHVFGYTILNDVTARVAQQRHKQWFLGKSLDGFCPIGPAVVTRDAVSNLAQCELRTFVNGELRQRAKIGDLIFSIPELIASISKYMKLLPGDIIATGTPAGVGIGFNPPRFLKPGDKVQVEIDGLGELSNPII